MIAQVVPSDAEMDPWCLVPLITGEQILFGYATSHPRTGGLSWLRSTLVMDLDAAAGRARTASGRTYRLGRRFDPAALPGEGEEAWVAYEMLLRDDAASYDAVPPLNVDHAADYQWVAACKMARHLGLTPPKRLASEVEPFVRQHADAYRKLRAQNAPIRWQR